MDDNLRQTTACLESLKGLYKQMYAAAELMDLEALNRIMDEVEALQHELAGLQIKGVGKEDDRPKNDSGRLSESIEELSRMTDETISNMLSKRDAVLMELKTIRKKRSARHVYSSLVESRKNFNESR